ncbi:Methyltransferase-like protein 2 [Striga hermonthica]|uniref:Methyltransferase-like protein 2 n=1 Tax=Striga hermonthica TaxID=68872 RepID=A0A9N7RA62_STRHE|nr:Methyltransferase-like protein 2 [Striga hermonthica]
MDKLPPIMAASESDDELSAFLKSGIYRFENANACFIDPVRVLNRSYTRFKVSGSAYYSRFFHASEITLANHSNEAPKNSKKRKRSEKKKKKGQTLNSREQMADQRHQEVRPALLRAHEALLGTTQLLEALRDLRNDMENCNGESISKENEVDFVEIGRVWQAPFYEIFLKHHEDNTSVETAESCCQTALPVFSNLIANEGSREIEAELLGRKYILPKRSFFYMSDINQIDNLIPADSDCGFNLIMIDPPWENSSAHQKQKYRTLPNRYFLSLPIKQLAHIDGALVALWVTNREKLRNFVENELFPKWGVKHAATFYWLKVRPDGLLVSELDLFHHRPYECLILGFSQGKDMTSEQLLSLKCIPDNQIFISVPGDYSRKPPIGEFLLEHVLGFKPARCIELFSREMMPGWTSWGNEPLHFQDSKYFLQATDNL